MVDVVDVNENAPEIIVKPMTSTSDGVAYIMEAAAATESFVALISTLDRDSGSNGYVRTSLHGHDHFKLQQAYGDAFMIVTTTTLDREKIPEYNLTLLAEDLGSPPFRTTRQYTIRVMDENDNAPFFSRQVYDISILENNVPGSYVTTVVARNADAGKNAKVSYKLLDSEVPGGGHISTYVSIDPLSGSLYTLRSLDYDTLQQIKLAVQAEDRGSPPRSSTSTIRIRLVDQNDNTPYLTFPAAPVLHNDTDDDNDIPLPVNPSAGYLALRAEARDEDEGVNGELTYRLLRGDPTLFAVHRDTGEVVLRRWLTANVGDVLELAIAVSDKGRSPHTPTTTGCHHYNNPHAFAHAWKHTASSYGTATGNRHPTGKTGSTSTQSFGTLPSYFAYQHQHHHHHHQQQQQLLQHHQHHHQQQRDSPSINLYGDAVLGQV
ncbi:hypothetical protein CRUP_032599 [Coryphaenoides rupestris]|nr:hypothetical protein CRUP_032599 [Coryphaenoides rupestris]